MPQNEQMNNVIGKEINRYIITRYIGSGSFGDVYEAKNKKTGEYIALKVPVKTKERDGQKSLLDEAKIYKKLIEQSDGEYSIYGIINMKMIQCSINKFINIFNHDINDYKKKINNEEVIEPIRKIIVMDLLGLSLETFFTKYGKKNGGLNIKTIIILAIHMIKILKFIHSCGYIHRDLKPDNFALGTENSNCKLYCIDMGLAHPYIYKNGSHIQFDDKRKFCGTARYASRAAHKGHSQSRKDDLEAIGYILVYLYKGSLPWQKIKNKNKEKRYKLIGEMKDKTSIEELCDSMPREFMVYLKYIMNLDFDEKPRYSSLINMFKKLYESRNYSNDINELEKEIAKCSKN